MARVIEIKVSATELPHFRRLVEFLVEMERFAEASGDDGLQQLVDHCREDLLRESESS